MFKKGDRVKVWSLQSFSNGGFLNGAPAIVRQSQTGESVILCVVRNFGGEYKLDKSYEVYAKQCELIKEAPKLETSYQKASQDLEDYLKELMDNKAVS